MIWHAPFESPLLPQLARDDPPDLFRYTTSAAHLLASGAGLHVQSAKADGGYGAVLASTVGGGHTFLSPAELDRGAGVRQLDRGARDSRRVAADAAHGSASRPGLTGHYLATAMVARRPQHAELGGTTGIAASQYN